MYDVGTDFRRFVKIVADHECSLIVSAKLRIFIFHSSIMWFAGKSSFLFSD